VNARMLAAVDAWQRTHPVAGFPLAIVKKFGEDRPSSLAALMAYYAFFSLFPLLLVSPSGSAPWRSRSRSTPACSWPSSPC
jgi:uncharacterized BrkB/YihY/UPF0761 family membrane protein